MPCNILIVDDEKELAALYAEWLKSVDHSVTVANDGKTAIEYLTDEADIIFLDRRMPGLSGDEVLDEIIEKEFDCQVAMVTAVEPSVDIISMGFDDYLTKPVTKEDLVECIDRLHQRVEYDEQMDELLSLAYKKTLLEGEKPQPKLNDNEEYNRLVAQLDTLRESVDSMVSEFNTEDIAAVLPGSATSLSEI